MNVKNINLTRLGHWTFLGGSVLAALAGFVVLPYGTIIFLVLGLVAGLLNIKEKESTHFLVAIIALLLVGVASFQFSAMAPFVTPVLNSFITFVSVAGLVVAIKQILTTGQSSE